MTKIVIDARMYGLEHSGVGRYILNLVKELQKIDTDNTYVLLLRKKYFNELTDLAENWEKKEVDIQYYTVKEQVFLPGIISRLKPDLVHFPHFNIPVFWEGKFVVTIHDMTMHKQRRDATTLPLPLYLVKRIPYKYTFRKAVTKSEKIITPSETVKAEIVDYYKVSPDKITVTYEGFEPDYPVDRASSREMEILAKNNLVNKDYFFYVGNAYPHKNLNRVVEAIVDINRNKGVSVLFVIGGVKDSFVERLGKFIKKQNANEFIRLQGFIPDDELRIIYKHSLGFVYPSLSEGFGLQGLEAISSGTVLLASNIPIFREIYDTHAFYFNPVDVSSISSTLYSVLSLSYQDKYKYSASAREYIKKYS